MLKIKDDFQLEKLKKYGFKIKDYSEYDFIIKGIGKNLVLDTSYTNYIKNLDTLYDLIVDGIVEKVSEKGE